MSTAWGSGSTRRWRAVRAFVLGRDGYRCRAHLDGWCARANRATPHQCTHRAELYGPHSGHAHHTRGKAFGDDPRWIVAACKACNLHIGDPAKGADPRPEPRTRW
jgi:hypothetical protein